MAKKIILLILSAAVIITMFSACSAQTEEPENTTAKTNSLSALLMSDGLSRNKKQSIN